jgi:hypothetical protein
MAVWAGEARAFSTRHHIDQLGISTFCNYLTLSDGRLTVQEVAREFESIWLHQRVLISMDSLLESAE